MLEWTLVDVFAVGPYSGNPLPVVSVTGDLTTEQMLTITRELRQFETVFLAQTEQAATARVRVFDGREELPFAGHPLLGAAAVLHRDLGGPDQRAWSLLLGPRSVSVRTTRTQEGFDALMDQGRPRFGSVVDERARVASAFSLSPSDLNPNLPLQGVSTGLAYLIVPVRRDALAGARIQADITAMLASFDAQFAVLLDEAGLEIRHWNNDGLLEDFATGSAAGTIAAYRLKQGLAKSGEESTVRQGGYAGRPSLLRVVAYGTAESVEQVAVGGSVVVMGRGYLERLP